MAKARGTDMLHGHSRPPLYDLVVWFMCSHGVVRITGLNSTQ